MQMWQLDIIVGYISPIPYLNVSDDIEENNIEDFIEAISNELVSYKSINEKFKKDNGVTFAKKEIADGERSGGAVKLFCISDRRYSLNCKFKLK